MKKKIINALMNYCKDSNSDELYVESISGKYDKNFGYNYRAGCILTAHPIADHYIGIYYVLNLQLFFIRLVDHTDSVKSHTYELEAGKISKSLQKILIYNSDLKHIESQDCPKKLILDGFKAK